jgi:hypothetical protein
MGRPQTGIASSRTLCEFALPKNQAHVMGDEGQLTQAIRGSP